MLNSQIERMKKRVEESELQNQAMGKQMKVVEERHREEKERMGKEKEEISKMYFKISHKEAQFSHEIKKRDGQFGRLQEQLKKLQSEKNVQYSNSMEFSSNLQTGPVQYRRQAETEFNALVFRGYDDMMAKLKGENEEMRELFRKLNSETMEIANLQRSTFLKRYENAYGHEYPEKDHLGYSPQKLNKSQLNMPFEEVGNDIIQTFQSNISKLRELIKYIGEEDKKHLSVVGIKY